MTRPSHHRTIELLAALLRGEAVPWSAFGLPTAELIHVCREESVSGLVYERISRLRAGCEWPADVRSALAGDVRVQAANELLVHGELTSVVNVLAAHDLFPVFLKGAALAYTLYEAPSSRPRFDTDLLISRDQVSRFRQVMAGRGYTAPLHCDGELLFCQFPLVRTDSFGVVHRFDCHWKISTQSVFADVLTFDEVAGQAIGVPALGVYARTLATTDALLLACIHPVMHHRNAESLIWIHDIHLLASTLSERGFERFADVAIAKKVSAICATQLRTAQARLGTRIPDSAMDKLIAGGRHEASAVYLRSDRHWIDELMSSLGGLSRWTDRLRLLREVVLPAPAYMLKAYGVTESALGVAILPVLYVHRLLFGAWKVVAGQK